MSKPNAIQASLSLAMLLSSLGTSGANVALPTLAVTFAVGFEQIQWVALAYLIALTASVVAAGWIGDLVGRRRLLLAGLFVFAVASALCGVAPTLALLIAARVAQGAGAAVLMALAVALVGDTVPKDRVGSAMGLLGTTSAVGTALGPALGGLLIAGVGWRAVFLFNVPVALLACVLAWWSLPADRPEPARGHLGSVASMLRDGVLRASLTGTLLVSAVVMTTLVVGPFHLSRLGLGTAAVGLVMSLGPLTAAAVAVPAGRLTDRLGVHRVTLAGLAVMAAASFALAIARGSVLAYAAPLTVLTAGYALFQAANNTGIMVRAGAGDRGTVSGLLSLARNMGLVVGASLVAKVYGASMGGLRVTFVLATLLVAAAFALARGAVDKVEAVR